MSQFTTVRDALDYLENLGDPDLIADDLYDSGVRAVPGCPDTCAVAVYILSSVTVFVVVVDGDEVFGRYDDSFDPDARFREVVGEHVHEFIVNFDCGRYPALILSDAVDSSDLEEVTYS